ncbi:MAG: hypothetical protein J6Y94_09000, partial [Bacteriovoracaceae bacterium]|nr:hypothetical protein [Bacteriovoracaceae bacterium]
MRLIIIGSALLMLLVSCGYRNPLSSGEDLVVGQKPSRAEKQNSASAKIDPAELFTTISKAVQETQDYLGGMSVQDFQDADIQATIDTFPAVSEEALQKVVAHDAGLREIANKLQEAINNFHSFAKIHDFSKNPDCISQFHKIQGIVTSLDDNSRDKNSPDKTSTNNIGALNQEMLDGYLLAAQESVSQLHSLEMCLLLGNIQKAM